MPLVYAYAQRDYDESEGRAATRPSERCADYACGVWPVRSLLGPLRLLADGRSNASTTRGLEWRDNLRGGGGFFISGDYAPTVADGCGRWPLGEVRYYIGALPQYLPTRQLPPGRRHSQGTRPQLLGRQAGCLQALPGRRLRRPRRGFAGGELEG